MSKPETCGVGFVDSVARCVRFNSEPWRGAWQCGQTTVLSRNQTLGVNRQFRWAARVGGTHLHCECERPPASQPKAWRRGLGWESRRSWWDSESDDDLHK